MQCPICAQPLDAGEIVMVCGPCHRSLGGGLRLNATGEFKVPMGVLADEPAGDDPDVDPIAERRPPGAAIGSCAWCGKAEGAVRKLIGNRGTALCDECVALAADIMDAELGADWR